MAIGDDWTIDYTDKKIYNEQVYDEGGSTTVYSVNQLYSHLQDTFDELNQLDDEVPMSAQTPTEYTMINGWFIDDESTQYLNGGAIKTLGYANVIHVLTVTSGAFVDGDIGLDVQDDGTTVGPLLAYNNTTNKAWIREERASFTAIGDSSDVDVVGGTQNHVADGDSSTGEDLYANVYTLGTIESSPAPQVYIFQAGAVISEWSSLTNWDRGHIDVLIKVKEADTEIDNATITVFARQYLDVYDNFEIDLTNGGRNAVPLGTSNDLDNTTPEKYLLYDTELNGPFQVGEVIHEITGSWSAEVISLVDNGVDGYIGIGGLKGAISNNDSFVGSTSLASGLANGTPGGFLVSYDQETSPPTTLGQVMTGSQSSQFKGVLRGVVGSATGSTAYLVMDTNGDYQADAEYYNDPINNAIVSGASDGAVTLDGTVISRGVAAYDDVGLWFVNGSIWVVSGTFSALSAGMNISGNQSSALGTIIALNQTADIGSTLMTLGNVSGTFVSGEQLFDIDSSATGSFISEYGATHKTTKAFEQATNKNYDLVVECRGRTLSQVYEFFKYTTREDSTTKLYSMMTSGTTLQSNILDGEEYINTYVDYDTPANTYTPKKASPFATFAGGKMFGAQGVWIENMHADDVQAFQLIDSDGATQDPPNKQNMEITTLQSGDRVGVFISGDDSGIHKQQYYSAITGNDSGLGFFYISGVLPTDTPSTGFVRVVDVGSSSEQRYEYSSFQNGSEFTLSGATQLNRDYLSGASPSGWDTAYIPMIDQQSSGTSISKTLIYSADRNITVRVRKKGIIPFETFSTFTSTGRSLGATRTTDTIVN